MRTQDPTTTDAALDPTDLAAHGAPSDNDSLTAVLQELASAGFERSFRPAREPVEGRAAVTCGACHQSTPAADLAVDQERRLEGASDPDDLVLAVAARCPSCGAGGVIVLGYGPNASPEDADLIVALDDPAAGPEDAPGAEPPAEDEPTADPGGDSDPDANEGFEPPSDQGAAAHEPAPGDRSTGPVGLGRLAAAIDGIGALDRVADPLRRTIDRHLPDRARDVLQGRWLGHPLHPMLTDLPIGFWTSAWVLDLVGGERSEGVADAFVAAGLVTAVPTAWSGWADWTELPRERRRSGIVHAVSNGTAVALYGASLVSRRRGDRRRGVRLAHAGAAAATIGGFLGGHLAFGD